MELILNAKKRDVIGKKVEELRKNSLIPAVLYGKGMENKNISVERLAFNRIFKEAGENTLIDLKVDDQDTFKVLIQEVQKNPLNNSFAHIDFRQIDLTQKIQVEVPIKFIGEAPAVKELGGTLVKSFDEIKIECLPKNLIHSVEVDISPLKTFEDAIHIKDINVPEGVDILNDKNATIATVEAPISEAELKALEEKPEEKIDLIEKVEEKKGEEVPSAEDKKE
jgi:large subunit ribosomal protein L25